MKVAINRCHGGFCLSDEAFEMLLALKGIEFDRSSKYNTIGNEYDYWRKGRTNDQKGYISKYDFYQNRDDPELIRTIETLGSRANGPYSKIVVAEVTEGVSWHIQEHDGLEWVAEDHRTWC
jgi:hypothetical protein